MKGPKPVIDKNFDTFKHALEAIESEEREIQEKRRSLYQQYENTLNFPKRVNSQNMSSDTIKTLLTI